MYVHNRYQQPGGEDSSMLAEEGALRAAGHRVVEYIRHNDEIKDYGLGSRATLPLRTVWSRDTYRELRALLAHERPDVVHFHNTFPLISPAAYYACREAVVPVVQTLHNYRLLCPAGTLLRDGKTCNECTTHSLCRAVLHACYRESWAATGTVAMMLAAHRLLGTWVRMVDCYIALTEFSRKKFIEAGLPAGKIAVKPNFVHPDPGMRSGMGQNAVCVGQLRPWKGIRTLLAAWGRLRNALPLTIVGEGPLGAELEDEASRLGLSRISCTGRVPPGEVHRLLKTARFLVFPSDCYETFGLTIVEAFACGVPVICSRLGAMEEIVEDGRTGLHFTPGDPDDLAVKVKWAWTHPEETAEMGRAARAEYEAKYTAERNYEMLMQIYQRVIDERRGN